MADFDKEKERNFSWVKIVYGSVCLCMEAMA